MTDFYVEIIEDKSGEVVKRMGPMPEHKAEKVISGVDMQLDHTRYTSAIVRGDSQETL